MLLPAATTAGTPVIQPAFVQAVVALAILAFTALAIFVTRKRLAWETCCDMPAGLSAPHGTGTGTSFEPPPGEPCLRDPGACGDGTEQGWLVLLSVTNPGCTRIRGRDFRAPLTFAFPGRQIRATRIVPEAPVQAARPVGNAPAIRLSPGDSLVCGAAVSRPARMYFTGDYVLRPSDSYTVMLVLSGTPTGPVRIRQEGSLTTGKIIPRPRSR